MKSPLERRQTWHRIIGVERRAAPIHDLDGHPLPDPTRLEDEEFLEARANQEKARDKALDRQLGNHDSGWFD